jgi:hypothetical protein
VVLRDDIDRRAATLLGQLGNDEAATLLGSALTPQRGRPSGLGPVRARRNARRRRLVVIPLAGALVLGSTGVAAALSGSRGETLYPLHRAIFGAARSSDGQISRDVAEAGTLLDHAAGLPFGQRGATLIQARLVLVAAQELLPSVSSSDVRARLSNDIAAGLLRAARLAQTLYPHRRRFRSLRQLQPLPSPLPTSRPRVPDLRHRRRRAPVRGPVKTRSLSCRQRALRQSPRRRALIQEPSVMAPKLPRARPRAARTVGVDRQSKRGATGALRDDGDRQFRMSKDVVRDESDAMTGPADPMLAQHQQAAVFARVKDR